VSAERTEMGKVFHMAGAAHENLLVPIVVDDAWVDNRSSPVDHKLRKST